MRLANVNIPDKKHIFIALTYIYGIGLRSAINICKLSGVDRNKLVLNLTAIDIAKVNDVISENYIIEGELKKYISMNIKSLIDTGSYRGRRHYNKLPVRGQRTHTNAKTLKKHRVFIINQKGK